MLAQNMQTSVKTVRKWKYRSIEQGVDGLHDLPRTGAPPRFRVEQRCEVIAITCDKPENYGLEGNTRWTLNTLTETVNKQIYNLEMSLSSVNRTLTEVDLKPHRINMWLHCTMNRRQKLLSYASTKKPVCKLQNVNMKP